jgi:endonuclease III
MIIMGLSAGFAVDTNVARVCARLGWVPLQSEIALEELDVYPDEPEVCVLMAHRYPSRYPYDINA